MVRFGTLRNRTKSIKAILNKTYDIDINGNSRKPTIISIGLKWTSNSVCGLILTGKFDSYTLPPEEKAIKKIYGLIFCLKCGISDL